jgi:hypothetical protein
LIIDPQVYFLGFRDGREAIARVNIKAKELGQTLLRDRVVSEVGMIPMSLQECSPYISLQACTLRYIKTHLSVPVPTAYHVNDKFPNPVGGRFIIEERVRFPFIH